MKIAIFPGSFDPLTNGHLDIIKRSLKIVDILFIGLFVNIKKKKMLFSIEERFKLLNLELYKFNNVRIIVCFNELLIEILKKLNINFLIRGIRNLNDFEYEKNLFLINKDLFSKLEILYLISNNKFSYITSNFIKEILFFNNNFNILKKYIPKNIKVILKNKKIN